MTPNGPPQHLDADEELKCGVPDWTAFLFKMMGTSFLVGLVIGAPIGVVLWTLL